MSDANTDATPALYFKVEIDNKPVGSFTSCKGLSFEVNVKEITEGGNTGFVHKLPGQKTYTNITFTRAVNSDSAKLVAWFDSLGQTVRRSTAAISLMPSHGEKAIVTWELEGVIPVKWSGPELDAENGKVAMETFEIAHHGFKVAKK